METSMLFFKKKGEVILGIVHPSGAGGGKIDTDIEWELRFSLVKWKRLGGAIEDGELPVTKRVTQAQLEDHMSKISALEIIRIEAAFEEDEKGIRMARLKRLLSKGEPDEQLAPHLAELKKPMKVADDYFTEFTLDKRFNMLEAAVVFSQSDARLFIEPDEQGAHDKAIAWAKKIFADQAKWGKRIAGFAVKELLDLKNNDWRGEDESAISPDEFRKRIRISEISINPEGGFEFIYNDGGLFLGHCIIVDGDVKGGPRSADIAG